MSPATLPGADLPHGRHERRDEGWSVWQRQHAEEHPDALTYGKHAAPTHDHQEEPAA